MGKLLLCDKIFDFQYDTPFQNSLCFSDTVKQVPGKTALIFLRYYGCPLCQFSIREYAIHYHQITAVGGQILIVLQSTPVNLSSQLQPNELPFDIIADPSKDLYWQFGVPLALSRRKLVGLKTVSALAKAIIAGYRHGIHEGEELQLPAAFVVDQMLTLHHIHYGTTADDVPKPAALAKFLT